MLDGYHLLHSVRGDLLAKLDRHAEAQASFDRAASLATNDRERELSQAPRPDERTAHRGASVTVFLIDPMPSTQLSTTSPARRNLGG